MKDRLLTKKLEMKDQALAELCSEFDLKQQTYKRKHTTCK